MSNWKINFPLVVEPFGKQECIVLIHRPVPNANGPHIPSTHSAVIGHARDGRAMHFIVETQVITHAKRVEFLETREGHSPRGEIYDPSGRILSAPID